MYLRYLPFFSNGLILVGRSWIVIAITEARFDRLKPLLRFETGIFIAWASNFCSCWAR